MTDVLVPDPGPDSVSDPVSDPGPDPRPGRDLARLSRRTLGLTDLLERRPELRGVSTSAEELVHSVLWSA